MWLHFIIILQDHFGNKIKEEMCEGCHLTKACVCSCMFLQSYLGTMQGEEICGYIITCSGASLLQDLYHQCSHESGVYLLFLMEHQPPSTHRIMDKRGKKVRQGKSNEDLMWSTVWWHTALAGEVQLRWWRWSMNGWSVENYLLLGESFKSQKHTTGCVWEQLEVITASPEHLAFSLGKNVL